MEGWNGIKEVTVKLSSLSVHSVKCLLCYLTKEQELVKVQDPLTSRIGCSLLIARIYYLPPKVTTEQYKEVMDVVKPK